MKRDRTLRWRVLRGGHYLDLVEEHRPEQVVTFIGLINGREAVRAVTRTAAGVALIQAACQ